MKKFFKFTWIKISSQNLVTSAVFPTLQSPTRTTVTSSGLGTRPLILSLIVPPHTIRLLVILPRPAIWLYLYHSTLVRGIFVTRLVKNLWVRLYTLRIPGFSLVKRWDHVINLANHKPATYVSKHVVNLNEEYMGEVNPHHCHPILPLQRHLHTHANNPPPPLHTAPHKQVWFTPKGVKGAIPPLYEVSPP